MKELIVQPTHVMSGFEYDDLMEVVKRDIYVEHVKNEQLLGAAGL